MHGVITRKITIQKAFAAGKLKYQDVNVLQPFTTAIVDPYWPYTVAPGMKNVADIQDADQKGRLSGFTRNRDGNNQYKQETPLTVEEIGKLPIGEVVGGYVFLWTVGPFLINGSAKDILDNWGFTPASILTWAKYDLENAHGYGGVGYWLLGNAEFCIIAKRKDGERKENNYPSIRTGRSSLFVEPKTKHSSKPSNVHRLCEERFPGPYLEVFGRERRDGWTVLGNEAPDDGKDIRESLRGLIP